VTCRACWRRCADGKRDGFCLRAGGAGHQNRRRFWTHGLANLAKAGADWQSGSMPIRNVRLTEHQDRCNDRAIADGHYQNASEVMREGLRLLERRDAEDDAKLARLRAAVYEARAAVRRGEYEEVADDRLTDWLTSLGATGRG